MSESNQKGANMMQHSNPSKRGYILAAVAGGIAVAIVTKAIPRLVSQIMAEMMSKMPHLMLDHMKSEGFDPPEMCKRMSKLFNDLDEPLTSKETQSV